MDARPAGRDDSPSLLPLYVARGMLVLLAAAYRYWVARKARPTFATSLPGATRPAAAPLIPARAEEVPDR